MRFKGWSPDATRQDRTGYSADGWTEGPGVLQSVWRYRWLVGSLVLLGILGASLLSATQPTRYEGVVRIFLTVVEGTGATRNGSSPARQRSLNRRLCQVGSSP